MDAAMQQLLETLNAIPPSVKRCRCVVQYAERKTIRPYVEPVLFDSISLESFYDECRSRSAERAGVFVGD